MNETPEQYTARILSNVGTADPLDVLAQTPARLRRAVEGRPVPQLMRKPQPERWSVGENGVQDVKGDGHGAGGQLGGL